MIKPTITDIAERLGITPSTVSRALAGNPRVKPSTREAVEKAAAEMGYERNVMAANLRKGTASVVGIIVPRINREFFSNIISSAEAILDEAGYSVIICQSVESLKKELEALRTLKRNQVAAVMISHSIDSADGKAVKEIAGNTRIIQFDRVFDDIPGPKVLADDRGGAYEATTHMIRQGYKKIGTLAGYMNTSVYRERLLGYRKALEDNGIRYDESIVFTDTILRETGYEAARKAIEAGCDALYSAGDYSALGAMDAVKEAGLPIPGGFGIVGTANETFTSLTSPTLSSVSQNPKEIGRRIAGVFLSGEEDGAVEIVPTELIVRESSDRGL